MREGDSARRLLELTQQVIEAMPGGVVHVLADGTIANANQEALRILGLSFDEITRKYTADFEPQTIWEDETPCLAEDYPVTRALATGLPQPRATIGVRRPDGHIAWAIFTAVPVIDDATGETTGAVVTFIDITERKRLEGRLEMSDRLASVGKLAAGVAHEINNPLTYVMANLHLLEKSVAGADPDVAARVREALDGAERIRMVVRDLSTFSHFGEERARPVDIHEILEFAIRMAGADLRHRASIVRDYGEVPPVLADDSRLGQVFLNLLVNAAQALPADDPEHNEVRITTAVDAGGGVTIVVSDTGAGVPAHLRERIFEPFVTTKPVGVGTGLGLSICRDIMRAFGGDIALDRAAGAGAVFRVSLPAAPNADPPAGE